MSGKYYMMPHWMRDVSWIVDRLSSYCAMWNHCWAKKRTRNENWFAQEIRSESWAVKETSSTRSPLWSGFVEHVSERTQQQWERMVTWYTGHGQWPVRFSHIQWQSSELLRFHAWIVVKNACIVYFGPRRQKFSAVPLTWCVQNKLNQKIFLMRLTRSNRQDNAHQEQQSVICNEEDVGVEQYSDSRWGASAAGELSKGQTVQIRRLSGCESFVWEW